MKQQQTVELTGSVRRVVKHSLQKVLHRQSDDLQNGLSVQTDMQGEDALDEYQKAQQIKQDLANQKGVAVTSEEYAVEFEKKANEWKTKSETDVKQALEQEKQSDEMLQVQSVQLIQKQQVQMKKEDLLSKIQLEIQSERERAKLLFAMENARKNAIDAARAIYGDKADIASIQKSYDTLANHLDPKAHDVTDMISMSIDNKLGDSDCVKVLMPNGSIRVMDADVVFAMSELSHRGLSVKKQEDPDVVSTVQNVAYSQDEIKALYELQDIMNQNAKKQASFEYKDPKSGAVEVQSVRTKRPLPTVAMDYEYIYRLEDNMQYKGRPLPSAMYSYTMLSEMQASGKTYGYYI